MNCSNIQNSASQGFQSAPQQAHPLPQPPNQPTQLQSLILAAEMIDSNAQYILVNDQLMLAPKSALFGWWQGLEFLLDHIR